MSRDSLLVFAMLLGVSAICHANHSTEPIGEEPSDRQIDLAVTLDCFGKYIWRGQNLDDDPVLQPGASATVGGITVSAWGNLETTDINHEEGEFTEFDWALEYSGAVPRMDGVSYSLGVIHYHFPSAGNTTELFAGLTLDCLLSPSVTLYRDVDEVDGTYAALGLSHSVTCLRLGDIPLDLELGAGLGWGSSSYNDAYWGPSAKTAELNDLTLTIALPFEVLGWTVTPNVTYVTLLGNDVRASDAFDTDSDHLFGGIGFVREF